MAFGLVPNNGGTAPPLSFPPNAHVNKTPPGNLALPTLWASSVQVPAESPVPLALSNQTQRATDWRAQIISFALHFLSANRRAHCILPQRQK